MAIDPLNPISASGDELVRQRAYRIYEQYGREPGHEMDDWLSAERELAIESHSRTRPEH